MLSEHQRVLSALSRARAFGLPATLTDAEWQRTVEHFGGLCAYCGEVPFAHMEHFVSVSQGGGTTPGNCLPACIACNQKKSNKKPEQYAALFGEERVAGLRTYLATRSLGLDTGVPALDDGAALMTFRIPRSLIAALDEYTEALNKGRDWPKLTRSDVMRGGLAWLARVRPDWESR